MTDKDGLPVRETSANQVKELLTCEKSTDIKILGMLLREKKKISISLAIFTVPALGITLYFSASILIPILFSIYLNILFSPLVLYLKRKGVPVIVSSAGLVVIIFIVMVSAVMQLGEPAEEWFNKAPKALKVLEDRVITLKSPLTDIQELSEKVENLADIPDGEQQGKKITLKLEKPGFLKRIAETLPGLVAFFAIIIFLTFFLLSAGDSFLRKIMRLGENYHQKRQILTITKTIQRDISSYLLAISLINLALGFCVFLAMWFFYVPNAILWGVLAMMLNFIPYLGPLVMIGILFLVGIINYPTLTQALYLPLAFFVLNTLESQLLTPAILGRRLSLSPPIIFISVIFWGWLWGISGALLAVPITVSIKVMLDNVPNLARFGQLMDR